jgi:hypothetical protein
MNEDGTPIEAPEGGEAQTTTESEVLEIMGKTSAELEETPAESEEVETPEAPVAEKTEEVEAPKEETPKEEAPKEEAVVETPAETPTFSVEVEDANGKKFTVTPDDNLEEVLAEFEPKNNGQVLQLMRDLDRLSGEKSKFEDSKAADEAEAAHAETISKIHESWDNEVTKLQGEKRLPLDAKIEDRKAEVFKFMAEENDKRNEDGRPLLQSFEDALDKLELREGKEAKVAKAKAEKERTKQRGGLVGGSSAPATSGAPVYRSGSARNSNEALRELGLLPK